MALFDFFCDIEIFNFEVGKIIWVLGTLGIMEGSKIF
jgi:hypothetical protein